LLKASHAFYIHEFKRENNELKGIGLASPALPKSNGALMLRIGRHSGAESVTLKRYRKIEIMQGRSKTPIELDHATTFWLASPFSNPKNTTELIPFGWCSLIPLPEEDALRMKTDSFLEMKSREEKLKELKLETISAVNLELDQAKPKASLSKQPLKSPVEKLLDELELINSTDAGRIGTVMQKMENLQTLQEKAEIAAAIRDKLGLKAFKKHKRKAYLLELIEALK
jgi:CRISPR-associated protein Csm5